MMMMGSIHYEHTETVRVNDTHEVEIVLFLTCTQGYSPGCFSWCGGGEPPSGPEFDLEDVFVRLAERAAPMMRISWHALRVIFGDEVMYEVFQDACDAACAAGVGYDD